MGLCSDKKVVGIMVRMENGGGQPWDVYVDRKIVHFNDSQKSAIVATIVLPGEKFFGYDHVPGVGYYQVYNVAYAKNWIEAVQTCAEDGSYLVIINSREEAEAIINLLRKNNVHGHKPWVGVSDLFEEGNFVTIFNENMQNTGFKWWHPREPDGGTKENCLWISYWYHRNPQGKVFENYGLGDAPCAQKRPFICEKSKFIDN
ncbi:Hemolymph lipopolysaccharide-binding protein [Blattella germanica]|nr:Hemolymph lipopolysaccharide-binding protein [Blattella germanica]